MVRHPITPRRAPSLPGGRGSSFRVKSRARGISSSSAASLIEQVEKGFSFDRLQKLESRSGIAISEIAPIVGIPERTLARRKAAGRFTWDESERLLRLSTIFEKAVDLFEGDVPAAANWVTKPQKALGNRAPLAYSRTEVGAREVENLIGRLEHGIFS